MKIALTKREAIGTGVWRVHYRTWTNCRCSSKAGIVTIEKATIPQAVDVRKALSDANVPH